MNEAELVGRIDFVWQIVCSLEERGCCVDGRRRVCEKLYGLCDVLNNLKNYIKYQANVDSVFKKLPAVGQLLGRLCSLDEIVCNSTIYSSLLGCVISLYTSHLQTDLETKARDWVLSQLRSAMCCSSKNIIGLHRPGHSGIKLTEKVLHKVVEEVCDIIGTIRSTWNPTLDCFIPCHTPCSRKLKDVAHLLFFIVENESFHPLLENILDIFSTQPNDETTLQFYQKLMKSQQNCYKEDGHLKLSLVILAKLWRTHLPSLEREILCLLDATTDWWFSRKRMKSIMVHHHGLLQTCAQETCLYFVTQSIFQKLIIQSQAAVELAEVIAVFYECLHDIVHQASPEVTLSLSRFYPSILHPLVNLMQFASSDFTGCEETVAVVINSILNFISSLPLSTDRDIVCFWFYLLHFRTKWMPVLLHYCLLGTKEFVPSCVVLMLWFHQPLSLATDVTKMEDCWTVISFRTGSVCHGFFTSWPLEGTFWISLYICGGRSVGNSWLACTLTIAQELLAIQECLTEVVTKLRELMKISHPTFHDLKCVVPSGHVAVAASLLAPLLLMFILNVDSGVAMSSHIFSLITNSSNPLDHLKFLLQVQYILPPVVTESRLIQFMRYKQILADVTWLVGTLSSDARCGEGETESATQIIEASECVIASIPGLDDPNSS